MEEEKQLEAQAKKNVVVIEEDQTITAAAELLMKHSIGSLIVTKNDIIVGILSERDIIYSVVAKGLSSNAVRVKDIMTRDVVTVDVKEGIKKIFDLLQKSKFRHLPIVDNGKPVGMVSQRDLLYLFDRTER